MMSENRIENSESDKPSIEHLMHEYLIKRIRELKKNLQNPDIQVYGADFEIARFEAYSEKLSERDFFSPVEINGTYDGEPKKTTEESLDDFFKKLGEYNEELVVFMKDHLDFLEEHEKTRKLAKEIQQRVKDERINNN